MPKRQPLMHVFRAGQQTTAAGASITFSEADLANCAKAYDPALHEAPICVGHPKTDLPAYGWISGLQASGADLLAERHQVDPEFAEACKAGRYKKISAAFYAPDAPANPVPGVWYLRHVAFLGAQPPAVKGLRQVEFADAEEGVVLTDEIEFSDPAVTWVADLFTNLREWFIGKEGQEAADRVLPRYQVDAIRQFGEERGMPAADDAPAQAFPAFRENTLSPDQETAVSTEQITQLQADLAAATAKAAKAETDLQAVRDAQAATARAARETAAAEFAEGLVTANKLLPADKPAVVAALVALEGSEAPVEFGEGDARKPVGGALRELLGKLPVHRLDGTPIATGSNARRVDTDDTKAIADAAVEFQEAEAKAGRHVSVHQAVQHIVNTQGAQQ